jgi:hypothetical protein
VAIFTIDTVPLALIMQIVYCLVGHSAVVSSVWYSHTVRSLPIVGVEQLSERALGWD